MTRETCPKCGRTVIKARTARRDKEVVLSTQVTTFRDPDGPSRYELRDGVAHYLDAADKRLGRPGHPFHKCPRFESYGAGGESYPEPFVTRQEVVDHYA